MKTKILLKNRLSIFKEMYNSVIIYAKCKYSYIKKSGFNGRIHILNFGDIETQILCRTRSQD